jgi:hypothetical protein
MNDISIEKNKMDNKFKRKKIFLSLILNATPKTNGITLVRGDRQRAYQVDQSKLMNTIIIIESDVDG